MTERSPSSPWQGRWVAVDGPTDHDVVLSVADRRGDDPTSVERELRRVEERFDVDEVYLSPAEA